MPTTTLIEAYSTPERITGQTIAKSRWTATKRKHLGAQWVLGRVVVSPTIKLAADVFGVSATLIKQELAFIRALPNEAETLDAGKTSLTIEERQALIEALGPTELWACLELATQ
jgi:hypothetical protein